MRNMDTLLPVDGSQDQMLLASGRRRVLVIDREPMIGRFVSRALACDAVTAFECPYAALARAKQERFDVVFCEFEMPSMSGIEFYEQLVRRLPGEPPGFALMTAAKPGVEMVSFLDSRPVQLLCKPFGMIELTRCIERALARPAHALARSEGWPTLRAAGERTRGPIEPTRACA